MIDCVHALNIGVGGHLMLKNELEEFITINSSARTMLRAVFGEVCTRACERDRKQGVCCVCRNAGRQPC
jgi:hypothetical protein